MSKYNKEYFFQTDEFKEKTSETNMKKYNVPHHMKSKEFYDFF